MEILQKIKHDYRWEIRKNQFHYEVLNYILRNIPGQTGSFFRSWLYRKHAGSVGDNCIFWPGVKVRNIERLAIGNNVEIGEDCFLQAGGGIELGDNSLIGPRSMIWSVNHNFSNLDLPIRQQGTVGDKVVIGADCWFGANVFVMPGVVLGDGCVVSAGAVVGRKKYPSYSILAGNPAKRIGSRQ